MKGKTDGLRRRQDTYCDLVEAGVIDPAKVVRTALQNAASVGCLLLTTSSLVTEIPEPEPTRVRRRPSRPWHGWHGRHGRHGWHGRHGRHDVGPRGSRASARSEASFGNQVNTIAYVNSFKDKDFRHGQEDQDSSAG